MYYEEPVLLDRDKHRKLRVAASHGFGLDGRSFTVGGLLVVDEQKLMALPDAAVLSLFRAGELQLVCMHLVSLENMKQLVDRMAQRGSAPSAPG